MQFHLVGHVSFKSEKVSEVVSPSIYDNVTYKFQLVHNYFNNEWVFICVSQVEQYIKHKNDSMIYLYCFT
jgi:hypothetical protein